MIKRACFMAWLSQLSIVIVAAALADESQQTTAPSTAIQMEIRATAEAFVDAFQKRDAAAIAAHWTEDGVYTDEEGQQYEGRQTIQAEYQLLFKNISADVQLHLEIDSIRVINSQTAIEEGRTALTPQPAGANREMSRYTAVHVKQDGRWLMADVHDTRIELPPDTGVLEDLDWLVGNWLAAHKDGQVEVKCYWVPDRHFLFRAHTDTSSGKPVAGGLEIIGRDPSTGLITSWIFANDGGHAVGIWTPSKSGWTVNVVGVMGDGTATTATNILSRKDDDVLLWKSVNRALGETLLPDINEVTLTRK